MYHPIPVDDLSVASHFILDNNVTKLELENFRLLPYGAKDLRVAGIFVIVRNLGVCNLKMDFHMKINTLCVVGTCPEAIKLAPVIKRLELDPRFNNQICVIRMHDDAMQSIFDLFRMAPHHHWDLISEHPDPARLTAKILLKLSEFFEQNRPNYVLVCGDSVTTLTSAISASYFHIPIVHLEAGLRNKPHDQPCPEDANRKLIGDLATLHFASTFLGRQNLLREGIASDAIYVSGSTAMDALYDTSAYIRQNSSIHVQLRHRFSYLNPAREMILVTCHRRENFGQNMATICLALADIAQRFPDLDIVFPVPSDPLIRESAHASLKDVATIFLIEPCDYLSFVYLMETSYLVLTDSGSIQEEAPSLGKPVLVLRTKTDRPEAVEAGTVKLVGADTSTIANEISRLLKNPSYYQQMSQAVNPYGDGKAAPRIIDTLAKHFLKHAPNQADSTYQKIRLISEI